MAEEKKEEKVEKGTKDAPISTEQFMQGVQKLEDIAKSLTEKAGAETEEADIAKGMIEGSDEIKKGVEVSAFLNDLVEETSTTLARFEKSIKGSNDEIVKGIVETVAVIKSVADNLKELGDRVQALEKSPAGARKSVISKGLDRFEGEELELSKSQVKTKLEDLIMKGEAHASEMALFEGSGMLKTETKQKIYKKEG